MGKILYYNIFLLISLLCFILKDLSEGRMLPFFFLLNIFCWLAAEGTNVPKGLMVFHIGYLLLPFPSLRPLTTSLGESQTRWRGTYQRKGRDTKK